MANLFRRISAFSNARMQTKILAAFSSVILLAVICFSVFSQSLFFERFETEATRSTQQLCIKISENIDTYVEKIDEITKRLMSDPSLLAVLHEVNNRDSFLDTYSSLNYSRQLGEAVSNTVALTAFPYLNVNIYTCKGDHLYAYRQNSSNFQIITENDELLDKLAQRKLILYSDIEEAHHKKGSISFVRAIFDFKAMQYGFIEIQDDTSKLTEICDINESGEVIITDAAGRILYTTGNIDQADVTNLAKAAEQDNNGFFRRNKGEIFFYAKSANTGAIAFIQYSNDSIYSSLNLMKNMTTLLIVAVSLVCLSLVFFFTKKLVNPIQDLRDSVLNVNYENMGLTIRSFDNNEIAMLGNAFQHILGELRIAIDKEIIANEAEANARFAALQAQISPHFIHNVLYSISICARENRPDDVTFMCKQLSDMLRYTVSPGKQPVMLKEELACISGYLKLVSKNYEDSLFYEVDITPEVEEVLIPRLSIQPFVENSIQHAFKMCIPPYWVHVACEADGISWRITISDNGAGIDPVELEKLERNIKECVLPGENYHDDPQRNAGMVGMGIANSILRIEMLYGKSFLYSISTRPEGGTQVVLEGAIKTHKDEESLHV